MSRPIYRFQTVELQKNGEEVHVQFRDGVEGTMQTKKMNPDDPLVDLIPSSLDDSGGLEVTFVTESGERISYPWDYFRRDIDKEFQREEEEIARQELRAMGRQVKKLRKEQDITQEELARRAGIGRATVSRLERGEREPSFRTLMKISHALRVPLQALFETEERPITA